jgi:chemotaxis protein histidine kinase CheA
MDDLLKDFIDETESGLLALEDSLKSLEESPHNQEALYNAFRIMHTLKGSSRFLKFSRLEGVSHEAENLLSTFRDRKKAASRESLDPIYETIETIKDILTFLEIKGREPKGEDSELKDRLRRAYKDKHDGENTQTPYISKKNIWKNLDDMVKDISLQLGKRVRLIVTGGNILLEDHVFEYVKDPVVQLIRNAIDHGIETPEVRRLNNKPEYGTIKLESYKDHNEIIIDVSDDGEGLATEKILDKALEQNLITENETTNLPEEVIQQFIFKPGFSTANDISTVSGRGIGMDIVYNNIKKTGGTIEFSNTKGQGVKFSIKIPDTLLIIS